MPLRIVQLEVELDLAGEVLLGDGVDVVGRRRRPRARRASCAPRPRRGVPDPPASSRRSGRCTRSGRCRSRAWGEFGEGVDPCVGDRVDRRGRACCICHAIEPRQPPATQPNGRQCPASFQSSPRPICTSSGTVRLARRRPCARGRCAPRRPTPPVRPRRRVRRGSACSTRERRLLGGELVVDVEQRDLHDVGRAALDRRVQRGALGVLAQHAVGAREVGERPAAAEDRLGVAVDLRLLDRRAQVVAHGAEPVRSTPS